MTRLTLKFYITCLLNASSIASISWWIKSFSLHLKTWSFRYPPEKVITNEINLVNKLSPCGTFKKFLSTCIDTLCGGICKFERSFCLTLLDEDEFLIKNFVFITRSLKIGFWKDIFFPFLTCNQSCAVVEHDFYNLEDFYIINEVTLIVDLKWFYIYYYVLRKKA